MLQISFSFSPFFLLSLLDYEFPDVPQGWEDLSQPTYFPCLPLCSS